MPIQIKSTNIIDYLTWLNSLGLMFFFKNKVKTLTDRVNLLIFATIFLNKENI